MEILETFEEISYTNRAVVEFDNDKMPRGFLRMSGY